MPRGLTTGRQQAMQRTQEQTMMDTCQIGVYSSTTRDPYNRPVATYTYGDAMACGYDPSSHREVQAGTQVAIADGTVRLPIGTLIKPTDRIRLTHRIGTPLSPMLLFDVLGTPEIGPSAIVVRLRTTTLI